MIDATNFLSNACNYPSGVCDKAGASGKCFCAPGKTGACCESDLPALSGAVATAALDFGASNIGSASVLQVVTFSNALDAATSITVANIALGGSNPGDFSLGGTCAVNASVSGGQACTITVTFTPGALGSRSATLTVNTSTTTLTGSGTIATTQIVIDPTAPTTLYSGLDGGGVFKSTDSGVTWAACKDGSNVENSGLTNLNIRSLTLTGSTLYAGTTAGVFTSANSCATWAAMSTGLP